MVIEDADLPPVTIATIAHEAGVSAPTVSKVLNGRSDVAAATRARVEQVIARHGYQRRHRPETRRSPLLDLVFYELESPWALEVIQGVEKVAHEMDLGVVISQSSRRTTPEQSWINSVLARRPTGVILVLAGLTGVQERQLLSRDIPFAVVDPSGEMAEDVPSVGSTNYTGGRAATRHLIDLGHRRIAVIGGPEDLLPSRARIDGYRAAMDAAGLAVDPVLVRTGDFRVDGGREHGRALLALPDRPTAVFAGNDLQAVGLYEAARECGLRIPEDLSVVGYDDVPVASWVSPGLTTVRQPLREMAETATRLVVRLSQGERPSPLRLQLATTLIVRESTAPPGTGAHLG